MSLSQPISTAPESVSSALAPLAGPANLDQVVAEVAPLRRQLVEHPLYARLSSRADLALFAEHHVYAVWDFMSLLKALQRGLTCVEVPWLPKGSPKSRRVVHELVLAEESDLLPDGRVLSHLELYLEAMGELGAERGPVEDFLARVGRGQGVAEAVTQAGAPCHARSFVQTTWRIVKSRSLPMAAAAFALGREDVIPDMFTAIVRRVAAEEPERARTFLLYLERHVELDGEEHGPASLELLRDVLGDDPKALADAAAAAKATLKARLALWDGILAQLEARADAPGPRAGC